MGTVDEIDVRMGELAVGCGKTIIKTGGVGSCVVIVLYDKEKKVGGLAHAMLPSKKKSSLAQCAPDPDESVAKYADEAVRRLAEECEKLGATRSHIVAKLIGGSHMFITIADSEDGIGKRNVEEARNMLTELGITIHGEEVGGTVGRIAELNLENGVVSVETKM